MYKFKTAIILFAFFEAIAVSLLLSTGQLLFLFDFTYISTCIAVGDVLKRKNAKECILCQKCKKECPVKALK